MPARFFAPDLRADVPFALPSDEVHHLRDVLRLDAGAIVLAFDGRGRQVRARIASVTRGRAVLEPLEPVAAAPEPAVRVTVAQAVLRTEKMDAVVRDVAMLGASVVQPIVTDRTNASRPALRRAGILERWTRLAVAGAKQSGRAVVPEIRPPMPLDGFLGSPAAGMGILLLEPGAAGAPASGRIAERPDPPHAVLLVGPEGGWQASEIDAARAAGFCALTLGARTIRADLAAVLGMAVLLAGWDALGGQVNAGRTDPV